MNLNLFWSIRVLSSTCAKPEEFHTEKRTQTDLLDSFSLVSMIKNFSQVIDYNRFAFITSICSDFSLVILKRSTYLCFKLIMSDSQNMWDHKSSFFRRCMLFDSCLKIHCAESDRCSSRVVQDVSGFEAIAVKPSASGTEFVTSLALIWNINHKYGTILISNALTACS